MKTRDQSKDKVEKKTTVQKNSSVSGSTSKVSTTKNRNLQSKKKTNSTSKNNKSKEEEIIKQHPYFSVNETTLNFDNNGGSKTIEVNTNCEYNIIIPPADWGTLNKQGNKLYLTVNANNGDNARTDYFIIGTNEKDIRIDISQAAKSAYLSVSSEDIEFPYSGGQKKISISTNKPWDVSLGPASWGSYTKETNSIVLNISENTSLYSRNDYIRIKAGDLEKTIHITQKGKEYTSNNSSAFVNKKTNELSSNYNRSNYDYTWLYQTDTPWYKGRFSFGWNIFDVSIFENTASIGTGLRFRIGKYSDVLNLITGVDYSYNAFHTDFEESYIGDIKFEGLSHQITIPFGLNINLFKTSKHSKFYIGCLAEYGIRVSECETARGLSSKNSFAVIPRIGFASKHWDWGLYYKKYLEEQNILNDTFVKYSECDTERIGLSLTAYF